MNQTKCGLFACGGPEPGNKQGEVPLLGVSIDARLQGVSTKVTHVQRYRNDETVAVETVYVFPLEDGAAVCGFAARIGDRRIEGRVEERDKAFEDYDDAMADGLGAFLLDQERPNVFTASVGNLEPGEEVAIEISYVALAHYEGKAVRLMIPTTVSPRYVPEQKTPEVGEPDGERVNPEHWHEVPYGLQLRVEIAGAVRSVDSPSHPIRIALDDDRTTVELARSEAALDRDFVLLAEPAGEGEERRPTVHLTREGDGTRVAMLNFFPEVDAELDLEVPSEVLFLLDCSGSMQGDSIDQAKRALLLSIRALGEGDSFNIVRFGSRHDMLWRAPQAYDSKSLRQATKYVEKTRANFGGTEILQPLKELLKNPVDRDRQRQILLLTDGQVSNEKDIIRLAEKHSKATRIFTFGIGAGTSEHLVREVARVSRGAVEFIFPGERIEAKVLRMFSRVRVPGVEVEISWEGLDVDQAPVVPPPVFIGESVSCFGRFQDSGPGQVSLTVGGKSWTLPIRPEDATEDFLVPTLWARHRIRDLESGLTGRGGSFQRLKTKERRRREEMVELGRRYGLLSSATSYVAIEERPPGERSDLVAELRKIPVALTTGWGGENRQRVHLKTGSRQRPLRLGRKVGASRGARRRAVSDSFLSDKMSVGAMVVPERPQPGIFGKHPARLAESSSASLDASDRLYDLLLTQHADGSFGFSQPLDDWLGKETLAKVRESSDTHGEALVVTAVVLALLGRDEVARIGEWRPAARKAHRFLKRHGGFDGKALLGPAGHSNENVLLDV